MDFPNYDDLFRTVTQEILTKNRALRLDAAKRDGTDLNILCATMAAFGDECMAQVCRAAADSSLDASQGIALRRTGFDRTTLLPKPAAPSVGTVAFSSAVAAAGAFTIPIGTLLQTADGVQFVTTQAVTYPNASTGPISVPVRAALAGIKQQAAQNKITSIVSSIPSATTTLSVTNPLATSGGDDAEEEEDYRARCRLAERARNQGGLSVIESKALEVPGVRKAKATEVLDISGRPTRLVQLIVSDAFTDALVKQDINPPAYQTQSQQLSVTVFNALGDSRVAGIYVDVRVAQVVMISVTLNLRFQAGVADPDLVALYAMAIVSAYTNSLSPGEAWSRDAVIEKLRTVNGLDVQGDEILSPAGDVVAKTLQVIRTSLNLITTNPLKTNVVLQSNTNPDVYVPG